MSDRKHTSHRRHRREKPTNPDLQPEPEIEQGTEAVKIQATFIGNIIPYPRWVNFAVQYGKQTFEIQSSQFVKPHRKILQNYWIEKTNLIKLGVAEKYPHTMRGLKVDVVCILGPRIKPIQAALESRAADSVDKQVTWARICIKNEEYKRHTRSIDSGTSGESSN